MTFSPRRSITDGLDHLAARLDPIIAARLMAHLSGLPWTAVLEQLDQLAGKPAKVYSQSDLQAQLKMFTKRLGGLGFPFDDNRQTVGTLGRELTIVRNAWAHGDTSSSLDAWRAHDYCVRLLECFGDGEGLLVANELRQEALLAYVEEQGIAPVPAGGGQVADPEGNGQVATVTESEPESEDDVITPDPDVYTRGAAGPSSVVGEQRLAFEPWEPVIVGDISVLNELPKLAAKQKVRAVAVEIVEAEGPIHIDRLAQLVAASFGVGRLHSDRAAKIKNQVKASGLQIDKSKFVWPSGVDPDTWAEFRPNSSQVDRPLPHISPVEIANAMRFLSSRRAGFSSSEIDSATLRTFGRRRRTQQFSAHLGKAKSLL